MRRSRGFHTFSLGLLLCAPTLAAQTAPASNASTHAAGAEDPEQLVDEGITLRTQARDAEALVKFQRAYQLAPTPRTMAQIALAEQALGQWVEADTHLQQALASAQDPWIVRNGGALRQSLTIIEQHVGVLEVTANVPGTELWMGARRIGTLPLTEPLRLPTGTVQVSVRAQGYVSVTRELNIRPGQFARENVSLVPNPAGGALLMAGIGSMPSVVRFTMGIALGAGLSFHIPTLRFGVRYGFLERFEVQAHGDITLDIMPFFTTIRTISPLLGVEAGLRIRPIGGKSPWYVGLGLAIRGGVAIPYDQVTTVTPPPALPAPTFAFRVGGVLESGVLFGPQGRLDLSVRFLVGLGLLHGVVALGYAF